MKSALLTSAPNPAILTNAMRWFRKPKKFPVPYVTLAAVAVYVALAAGLLYAKEFSQSSLPLPFGDQPPQITLTWSPDGVVDLMTTKVHLHMKDDHGLDFTTYRLTVVETGRTIDMPIKDLVGKDYETDLSFSWLAGDQRLRTAGKMTVIVSIADDHGHKSTLTRIIPLRARGAAGYPASVRKMLEGTATAPRP